MPPRFRFRHFHIFALRRYYAAISDMSAPAPRKMRCAVAALMRDYAMRRSATR